PSQPQVIDAEAPGLHQRPGDVLEYVTDPGELPIEDAGQSVWRDHEVPDAEVAVHHHRGSGIAQVLAQPGDAELDGRMRLTDGIELRDEPVDGAARGRSGASAGKEGQPRGSGPEGARSSTAHASIEAPPARSESFAICTGPPSSAGSLASSDFRSSSLTGAIP